MEKKLDVRKLIILVFLLASLLAFVLLVVLPFVEEHTPSKEGADLYDYFGVSPGQSDVAFVMLGDLLLQEQARIVDGVSYMDVKTVKIMFNDCFYAAPDGGPLLLTTAEEVVRAEEGERGYTRHAEAFGPDSPAAEAVDTDYAPYRVIDGEPYVALDYVQNFANFDLQVYEAPWRVRIERGGRTVTAATVVKSTQIRIEGNRSSPLLRELETGERVTVLEEFPAWTRVRTADMLVGYVLKGNLSEPAETELEPVTGYTPPPYTNLTRDGRICLVWHQVTVYDANQYLFEMLDEKNASPVNVVSPTWFHITDASGALDSIASKDYVEQCHARGIEVWALVDDFANELDRHALLAVTENRHTLIKGLISAAAECGFDGINIDFELLPTDDGEHFSQFLREMSVACRQAGLVLSVDNYVPRAHSMHYNRTLQGEVCDYVIIMGYDEHYDSHIGIGSVASIGFVRSGIRKTLLEVPPEKTINGVPFYTRVWVTYKNGATDSTAIGQKSQAEWVEKRELTPEWDERTGQNYVEYEDGGNKWQIWLEDADSMAARAEMMDGFGIGGVAGWRLGLESAEVWPILGDFCAG
ncbi:MAG: SH3 domain-containing protein [Clostridiales Family XIII bacterium]|jgi:spore germination protein YaaH|nr:SH3 domain-containing protein [Clostridiales Family XIII bacterium]